MRRKKNPPTSASLSMVQSTEHQLLPPRAERHHIGAEELPEVLAILTQGSKVEYGQLVATRASLETDCAP